MKLLYRKSKYIDESFPDYLARLSYLNGYQSSEKLIKSLLQLYRKEYEILYYKNGWWTIWLKCRAALEHVLRRSIPTEELNLVKLRRGDYKRSRICTECWKDKPYVRFFWRLDGYRACHVHDTPLSLVDDVPYDLGSRPTSVDKIDHHQEQRRHSGFLSLAVNTHSSSDAPLIKVLEEDNLLRVELQIWRGVADFLLSRFLINIDKDRICARLASGANIGVPAWERIEVILQIAVSENKNSEKLIRLATVLQIVRGDKWLRYPAAMKEWAVCEAYSINPLCYSCINGIREHVFALGYDRGVQRYIVEPLYFPAFSDRQLCEFILESSVLTPSETRSLHQEGKKYQYPGEGHSRIRDINKYIDATEQNLLSGPTESRAMSRGGESYYRAHDWRQVNECHAFSASYVDFEVEAESFAIRFR